MADPLSIAGSVVGITAAGVQASVKLYALAEKVATASQRVTSIADDISSTCAILNQVRELIIPQPDAQGTLKSVFNSVALNDISHALRRCRSSFTDIEALLRRAFEQVGKRPALRSNIKLSRFEQAKWPFLQPQFDELRNDLRDAKGNLVLMIAVASLALAQRDGRQRPIHEMERLDLGSTIVQLQRASTVKTQPQYSSKIPRREVKDSQSFSTSGVDADTGMSSKQTPMSETANSAKALLPGPPALETFTSASSDRAKGNPVPSTRMAIANMSLAYDEAQVRAAFINTMPHPSLELGEPVRITSRSSPGGIVLSRKAMAYGPSSPRESHLPDQPIPAEPMSSIPSFELTQAAQGHGERSQMTSADGNTNERRYYLGWTTDYLPGLATGYGDSVIGRAMDLPQKSLEALVKTYTDEGNDPHIAMLELTREQQGMIAQSLSNYPEAEVLYVRLQRNVTVSSIFGILNAETFKWIVALETGRDQLGRGYSQHHHSAQKQPTYISYDEQHARQRDGYLSNQPMPAPTNGARQTSFYKGISMGPSRPSIYHHHMTSNPPPSIYPEAIKRESDPHPRASASEPARTHILGTDYEAFDRTSVKFTDASKPGEYSRQSASEAAEHVDPSTSMPTEYDPDVDAWAAQYTDPSALILPSMPLELELDLDAHAADSVDPATTVMPDADDEPEELEGDDEPSPSPPRREDETVPQSPGQYLKYDPYPGWDTTSSRSDRTGYNTVRRYEPLDELPRHAATTPSIANEGVAEESGEDIVNELLARWTTP